MFYCLYKRFVRKILISIYPQVWHVATITQNHIVLSATFNPQMNRTKPVEHHCTLLSHHSSYYGG